MKAYYVRYPLNNDRSSKDIRNLSPETLFDVKEYLFLSTIDMKPGDLALAESTNGLSIVQVAREGAILPIALRFLLGKFDQQAFSMMVTWHEEQRALRQRIQQRVKDLDETHRLKALAQSDEQLAQMLQELDALNSVSPLALATGAEPTTGATSTSDN